MILISRVTKPCKCQNKSGRKHTVKKCITDKVSGNQEKEAAYKSQREAAANGTKNQSV